MEGNFKMTHLHIALSSDNICIEEEITFI